MNEVGRNQVGGSSDVSCGYLECQREKPIQEQKEP